MVKGDSPVTPQAARAAAAATATIDNIAVGRFHLGKGPVPPVTTSIPPW
jgi:hypothetical protein